MTRLPELVVIDWSSKQRFRAFRDAAVMICHRPLKVGLEAFWETSDEVFGAA